MNIKVEYTYFIDEDEIIRLYELDHYSTEYDMEKAFWGYIAGMDDGPYYDLINKEAQFVEVAKKKLKYTFIGFDSKEVKGLIKNYGEDLVIRGINFCKNDNKCTLQGYLTAQTWTGERLPLSFRERVHYFSELEKNKQINNNENL